MFERLNAIGAYAVRLAGKAEERISRCSDRMLLLALSAIYLIWRILTLPVFEFGGDAAWKWRILRYFYATGTWFPEIVEHHQGRWAQNLPVYWTMKLFGSDAAWVASVIPVLTGLGVLILVYLLARRTAGKNAALLAALSVLCYPPFVQESAQFLPDLAAAFYVLLGLFILSFHVEKSRWYLPLMTGIVMGLAWGCKVTTSYWLIGMEIALLLLPGEGRALLRSKRIRMGADALLLGSGFLLVLVLESVFLMTHFDAPLGRVSFLLGHTGSNPNLYSYNVLQYLFSPLIFFLDLHGKALNTVPQAILFLLTSATLIGLLKKSPEAAVQKLLLIAFLTAGFLHCYMVVRIFPFKHPERPLIRYFLPLACVAFILLYTNVMRIFMPFRNRRQWAICLAVGLGCVMWGMMLAGAVNDAVMNQDNLFSKCRVYHCLRSGRERNLPLLVRYHHGRRFSSRTRKLIILWRSLFAPPAELPVMQGGKLEILAAEWEKTPPVVTADGDLWFLLAGPRPRPGESRECVAMDELSVQLRTLTFATGAESGK